MRWRSTTESSFNACDARHLALLGLHLIEAERHAPAFSLGHLDQGQGAVERLLCRLMLCYSVIIGRDRLIE